jgi:choline kinase
MPKCMVEIGGRTILTRLIDVLSEHLEPIHVVIGYREEMLIEYCARHHRDVVLVRNPEFRTTTTAQSYALGAAHLAGKVLFLDGDLILSPDSVAAFVRAAAEYEVLIGVTDTKSENAVMTSCTSVDRRLRIHEFSRVKFSPYEWANVVAAPSSMMQGATGYVYERLAEHLPLPAHAIELNEIDTAADLEAARASGLVGCV